jgi:hypothetical protein
VNSTDQQTCVHHWLIDPPVMPTSTGRCVHCHASREFQNSHSELESRDILERTDEVRSRSILGRWTSR